MSDNKKYYYLKLKDNYFDQDSIKVIEALPNGHIYSLIILKLYVKSCKYGGELKMNHHIPYSTSREDLEILANVINHDLDHLEKAIKCALKFGLISVVDQNQLWMTEIQNFIGHSSTEADRIREYRKKISSTNDVQMYDKSTPEREIEKEIKKEREIKKPPTLKEIQDYIKIKNYNVDAKQFYDYFTTGNWIDSKGNKVKNWKQKIITWNNHSKKPEEKSQYELITKGILDD